MDKNYFRYSLFLYRLHRFMPSKVLLCRRGLTSAVILLVSVVLMILPGCSLSGRKAVSTEKDIKRPVMADMDQKESKPHLLQVSQDIAREISADLIRAEADKKKHTLIQWKESRLFDMENYPLAVMTFTDTNNLQASADFGRTLTECLIASFEQEGFHILELRKAHQIHIEKGNGEYLLSRDITQINQAPRFSGALVGTYTIMYDSVIINSRLLDVLTGEVMASSSKQIEIDERIFFLLTNGGALTEVAGRLPQKEIYLKSLGVTVFDRRLLRN